MMTNKEEHYIRQLLDSRRKVEYKVGNLVRDIDIIETKKMRNLFSKNVLIEKRGNPNKFETTPESLKPKEEYRLLCSLQETLSKIEDKIFEIRLITHVGNRRHH